MRKIIPAALLCAALAAASVAPAVAREQAAAAGAQFVAKATVESVDMATRHVLLRDDQDGRLQTITVGPEARNLGQVKPGDRVLVRVRIGMIAELAPAGGPAVVAGQAAERAPEGARPAGVVGDAVRVRVTFDSYDRRTRVVNITLPDGTKHHTVLRTKAMQDFAAGLKSGEKVDVTFVRSLAVAVEPS